MDTTPEITAPCWNAAAGDSTAPVLAADANADVCVVGAGVAGLTTAYLLAREGRDVAVIDSVHPGAGDSALTTAHVSNAIEDRYYNLERWHGADGARLAAESHSAAIDQIERIIETNRIACDFQRLDGYLFCADGDSIDVLQMEYEAAHRAGLEHVVLTEKLPALYPRDWRSLRFPRQGQLNPVAYLHGLVAAIVRHGGRIFGGTRAVGIREGATAAVVTEHGAVMKARDVVLATNLPFDERFAAHTKHTVYVTHVLAGPIPEQAVPAALYWDTADPNHHVRLDASQNGFNRLIVGGEDLPDEDGGKHTAKAFRALEEWARHHFPSLDTITHRWTNRVVETIDGLSFIGRNPGVAENVYSAAGDCGMGMTRGTIAGMLISDLILGRPNPWEQLYRPGRISLAAAVAFARENSHVSRKFLHWGQPREIVQEPTATEADATASA